MIINNTRASTFEDCRRRYYWSYVHGGQGVHPQNRVVVGPDADEPNPLMLGELIHSGLAILYSGHEPTDSCEMAWDLFKREYDFDNWSFEEKNIWIEWKDWLHRMICEYQKWSEGADDFSIFQIETEGEVVLGDNCYACGKAYGPDTGATHCECGAEIFRYAFRVDLAVNRGGGLYIMDHKSTKSVGADYLSSWHDSMQMFGYCYAYSKSLGIPVNGYGMNIIRKVKSLGEEDAKFKQCPSCRGGIKKRLNCLECGTTGKVERKDTTSSQPFIREWCEYGPEQEKLFLDHRIGTMLSIEQEHLRGLVYSAFNPTPRSPWSMNPRSCYSRGRCPYRNLCWLGNASDWSNPNEELLRNFDEREDDYVDDRALYREEMS